MRGQIKGFKHSEETKRTLREKMPEIMKDVMNKSEVKEKIRAKLIGHPVSSKMMHKLKINNEKRTLKSKLKKCSIESNKLMNYLAGNLKAKSKIIRSDSYKEVMSKIKTGHFVSEQTKDKLRGKKRDNDTIQKIKIARSKQILPIKDSSIELKIQNYLDKLHIEFEKHKYMHIAHGYQCDIFIPSMNLVIECDGNYWHKYPDGNEIDCERTTQLEQSGLRVLRMWETEINKMEINDFVNKIDKYNYCLEV